MKLAIEIDESFRVSRQAMLNARMDLLKTSHNWGLRGLKNALLTRLSRRATRINPLKQLQAVDFPDIEEKQRTSWSYEFHGYGENKRLFENPSGRYFWAKGWVSRRAFLLAAGKVKMPYSRPVGHWGRGCHMKNKPKLRFGLPKGSLQEATIEKMAKAGFNIQVSSRSYIPYVDDEELDIRLIRAQEISRYVEHGYLDCGITGHDWIQENDSKVYEVGEFQFSKVTRQPARWVLAVPENSAVRSVKDLKGKRIATEVVNLTRKYLRKHGVKAEVEFSWGATEFKAHELVDAIVELTETGSSLRAHKLRVVDTLLSSTPRLISNHDSWKDRWKRRKIETMALLLKGALEAEAKVGLKMNIAEKNLAKLLHSLPALRNPTVSSLSLKGWVAVETIIDEHVVRELIPQLKAAGAEGIIEYSLNKVIY